MKNYIVLSSIILALTANADDSERIKNQLYTSFKVVFITNIDQMFNKTLTEKKLLENTDALYDRVWQHQIRQITHSLFESRTINSDNTINLYTGYILSLSENLLTTIKETIKNLKNNTLNSYQDKFIASINHLNKTIKERKSSLSKTTFFYSDKNHAKEILTYILQLQEEAVDKVLIQFYLLLTQSNRLMGSSQRQGK